MIDLERHLPTFASWVKVIQRSPVFSLAQDTWRSSERRCVIEIGRGVRRITIWELGQSHSQQVKSRESKVTMRDQLDFALQRDLVELGATGLPCELILHPPWSVAKLFKLSQEEANNPIQWITRHRGEVFPSGIEDDISLCIAAHPRKNSPSVLLVGLARRSILQSITSTIERAGCILRPTILGPLGAYERTDPNAADASYAAIENTGEGSAGCWLIHDGQPSGWVELPVDSDNQLSCVAASEAEPRSILDDDPEVRDLSTQVMTPPYTPITTSASRWRLPLVDSESQDRSRIEPPSANRQVLVLQSWLGWTFRWATAVAVIALILAVVNSGVSAIALALTEPENDRVSDLFERRETLRKELQALESRSHDSMAVDRSKCLESLWFDLGMLRPSGLWLRQITIEPSSTGNHLTTFVIEGLAVNEDAPRHYSDSLASRSGYMSRVTRLERMDTSNLKDLPASFRPDLYRFAIEIRS